MIKDISRSCNESKEMNKIKDCNYRIRTKFLPSLYNCIFKMVNNIHDEHLRYSSIEEKKWEEEERKWNGTIVSLKRNAEKRATNKSIQ